MVDRRAGPSNCPARAQVAGWSREDFQPRIRGRMEASGIPPRRGLELTSCLCVGRLGRRSGYAFPVFHFAPRFVQQHKVRNLSFEQLGGLLPLRLLQRRPNLVVKPVQIHCGRSTRVFVEGSLQMSNDEDGMVDFPRAGFHVVLPQCIQRASQIIDRLFVQQDHQPKRAGASYCSFAIRESCVHCF